MPLPNDIFAADATKLIAGSSYVNQRPFDPQDPEAPLAFVTLTDILANNLQMYFQKREKLDYTLFGAVGQAWIENVTHCLPPERYPAGPPLHVDANIARRFKKDLGQKWKKLYDWANFQSQHLDLSRFFWTDNTEEEILTELQLLTKFEPALVGACTHRFERRSRQKRTSPHMGFSRAHIIQRQQPLRTLTSDGPFLLGFLIWNYLKGFRYFSTLKQQPNRHAYVSHFCRSSILTHNKHGAITADLKGRNHINLFPWGAIAASVAQRSRLAPVDYGPMVGKLRTYSASEFKRLDDYLVHEAKETSLHRRHRFDLKLRMWRAQRNAFEFAAEGIGECCPFPEPHWLKLAAPAATATVISMMAFAELNELLKLFIDLMLVATLHYHGEQLVGHVVDRRRATALANANIHEIDHFVGQYFRTHSQHA